MAYTNIVIYYFSGTGNARHAAEWIKNTATKKGLEGRLVNIDRFKSIDTTGIDEKTLIGFCFPTHGFNSAPIMFHFICKFPGNKHADVFILNTRAGLKLSKMFLPGVSGLAQIFPAIMLMIKGYRIVGMQPLDLPSNWLLLHPGLREKVVNSIYSRCRRITKQFAAEIVDGQKKYKALLSLPIDVALIPIAVAYYFLGRFFLAKTLIATDACSNCDLCIQKCPVGAIHAVNDRPFWTYKCESCMRCVNLCPHLAIETAHGFSGLVIVLFYFVIIPLIYSLLARLGFPLIEQQLNQAGMVWSVISGVLFLGVLFLSYKLIHSLMKYNVINRVIAYSSLSKYKFWRRYKAPKQYKL
jgi:Pyruvate/2-oxoacid:ferredoxin oxidoreductase delta subunit